MNRSAKDGVRSSPHYGGEGVLIHPSHQGVCWRHDTEESCTTPGDLFASRRKRSRVSDPISASETGNDARTEVGERNSTTGTCRITRVTGDGRSRVIWGSPFVNGSSGM
jgi:hypothetical protein